MTAPTDRTGHTYPPGPAQRVTRDAIAAFAAATGARSPLHSDVAAAQAAGYADVVAPPTFAVVLAQQAEAAFVQDPAAAIDFSRVVHGEESFEHTHPLVAGDDVVATVTVERDKELAGNRMVTTRTTLATTAGEPRCQVRSTLVVRGA